MSSYIERKVRRNQIIYTFGIGQMMDFPCKSSLMLAGLDMWDKMMEPHRHTINEFVFNDERLQRKLGVDHFITPPDFRKKDHRTPYMKNHSIKLPYVRFPLWHYCTNCKYMKKTSLYSRDLPVCDKKSSKCRK